MGSLRKEVATAVKVVSELLGLLHAKLLSVFFVLRFGTARNRLSITIWSRFVIEYLVHFISHRLSANLTVFHSSADLMRVLGIDNPPM